MGKIKTLLAILCIATLVSSCAGKGDGVKIRIIDVKTATGIDAKYMPVNATKVFPSGTSRVFCWFSWNNAQKDLKILAKWYYLTDDLPVLDYTFTIPRKEGMGSVSLAMPEGKSLPPGLYRVSLEMDNRTLKMVTFKVASAS